MHPANPLRSLETSADDILLRERLVAGVPSNFPRGSSGEIAWRFVEETCLAVGPTVTMQTSNLDFTPPGALVDDPEAWNMYTWAVVADLATAATRLALISIGGMLAALESELVARRLVPATVLARALLEHAAMLDHITTTLEDMPISDWLADDGKRIRSSADLPLELITALFQTIAGGKIDWTRWDAVLTYKEVPAAREGLKKGQTALNVLTAIEKREKRASRTGLSWMYQRLCEIAHPSRGSRELLYFGMLQIDGKEVSRDYSALPPSDHAYLDRVATTVVPVVQETALILLRYSELVRPSLDDLQQWTHGRLADRGHDAVQLLREDKDYVRAAFADARNAQEEAAARGQSGAE